MRIAYGAAPPRRVNDVARAAGPSRLRRDAQVAGLDRRCGPTPLGPAPAVDGQRAGGVDRSRFPRGSPARAGLARCRNAIAPTAWPSRLRRRARTWPWPTTPASTSGGAAGRRPARAPGAERARRAPDRDQSRRVAPPALTRAVDLQRLDRARSADGLRQVRARERRGNAPSRAPADGHARPPWRGRRPCRSRPASTARAHRAAEIDAGDRAARAGADAVRSKAMAKAGRPKRSFSRAATSPTTPGCQLRARGDQHRRPVAVEPSAAVASASASASVRRFDRLALARSAGRARAAMRAGLVRSSVVQQPRAERASPMRPPALMRGPSRKPR